MADVSLQRGVLVWRHYQGDNSVQCGLVRDISPAVEHSNEFQVVRSRGKGYERATYPTNTWTPHRAFATRLRARWICTTPQAAWKRLFAPWRVMPKTSPIACHDRPTSRAPITASSSARSAARTEAYLRNRNSCEGRIIDCGHRIRTIPVVGVLDLVKHLFGGLHILLPPQELLARRHSMKDEAVIIDTDLDQVTDREGPTMMTYPSK